MNKVVITGAGVVSPIGSGLQEFFSGLEAGQKGIGSIENFDTRSFPLRLGAEAKKSGKAAVTAANTDRKALFVEEAIAELLKNNNAFYQYAAKERYSILGAGIDYFDIESYINSGDEAKGYWEPYYHSSVATARKLAEQYEIRGACFTNVAACVASSQAIGLGFRLLREKSGRAVISGGFDSMLCPLHYMGFYKLGALSSWQGAPAEACRPFDKKRCGLVLGEGAAAYLMQCEQEAEPSQILAEIVGYSSTMDAYMVTDPEPEGTVLAQAMKEAIANAGLSPKDIDAVHVHGTGTLKNEPAETKAMRLVFGERYDTIPVFSLKGQVGHLIGACGAMELLAVIHSLQTQQILPTVNFDEQDPEALLRVIKGAPLKIKLNTILKINAAFGGQNTALVVKRYENNNNRGQL